MLPGIRIRQITNESFVVLINSLDNILPNSGNLLIEAVLIKFSALTSRICFHF